MNLRMVGGMVVFVSLRSKVVWFMVSKALLKSIAVAMVRRGGFCLLNPAAMWSVNWCSAVTVECFCLKPC